MAIKELSKIDSKLIQMYADQVTTTTPANYPDRSDMLFEQMNFIALNNKSFLHLK